MDAVSFAPLTPVLMELAPTVFAPAKLPGKFTSKVTFIAPPWASAAAAYQSGPLLALAPQAVAGVPVPAVVTAQIVRVTLSGNAEEPWVIGELRILVD